VHPHHDEPLNYHHRETFVKASRQTGFTPAPSVPDWRPAVPECAAERRIEQALYAMKNDVATADSTTPSTGKC
jgi:hypothetical protein